MRFYLTFEVLGVNKQLPINYQYELSSWIYKTIHFGNPVFAEWLHSHGYMDGNKQFKLFTFSNLKPEKYTINGDRLELQSHRATIHISFFAHEAATPFITGLFQNQQFSLGDKISNVQFRVNTIEKLPEPQWSSRMLFRTESPLIISKRESETSRNAKYLSPEESGYGEMFLNNLIAKYDALQ